MSGLNVMMQLGSLQFGISTAAFQELSRTTEYKWAAQQRFGQSEALQFVGMGGDTITLTGVVYAMYRGGLGVLPSLRTLAALAAPQTMVSGTGAVMGRWVIERVDEGQTMFATQGLPKRQEFTMALRYYDAGQVAPVAAASSVLSGATSLAVPSGVASMQTSLSGLASSASLAATNALASVTTALAPIKAAAGDIGSTANQILGAFNSAKSQAQGLQTAAKTLSSSFRTITSLSSAQSALSGITSAAGALSSVGARAAGLARVASTAAGLPSNALAALATARTAAGSIAVGATSIYTGATDLARKLTT